MKNDSFLLLILMLTFTVVSNAQYVFTGALEEDKWNGSAYLSLIEDYRKVSGVHTEQIISKVNIINDIFEFKGNNLHSANRIYRIHVDNCSDLEKDSNHFNGQCSNSQEVIFIANNRDTINLPISLENQMFCSILSSNKRSNVFFRIDSLKEVMSYDYGTYRSNANRKLNNRKWFRELQQFGEYLKEPLAELYIYEFLSDRSSDLYSHYMEDLDINRYYDELHKRLQKKYPESSYLKQYEKEITSDIFTGTTVEAKSFSWKYLVYLVLGVSILVNIFLWFRLQRIKKKHQENLTNQLTQQEQKILELILQEKTNKEIASEVFVSVSTVKTHINNLYKKLEVQSREQVKLLFHK